MKTAGIVSTLFAFTAALGGCGVGPYHTPDVAPVVMPEPEEDIFADLDFDTEDESSGEGETDTSADEEPAAEETPADAPEAGTEGEAAAATGKPAKPAADDKSGEKKK